MKKNLRIVSAAAAALLAVAPVAATVVPSATSSVSAATNFAAGETVYANKNVALHAWNGTALAVDNNVTVKPGDKLVIGNGKNQKGLVNVYIGKKSYYINPSDISRNNPLTPDTYQIMYTKADANVYSSTDENTFTVVKDSDGKNIALPENTTLHVTAKTVQGSTGTKYYKITDGEYKGDYVEASMLQPNAYEVKDAYFRTAQFGELSNDATVYANTDNSKAINIAQLKKNIENTVQFGHDVNGKFESLSFNKYVFNSFDADDNYLDHGNATSDADLISQLKNAGIAVSGTGDGAKFDAGSTTYSILVRSNNGKRVTIVFQNTDAINATAPAFSVRSDVKRSAGADSSVDQIAERGPWGAYFNENNVVPTIDLVQRDNGTFNPRDYIKAVNNINSLGLINFDVKSNNVDWTKPGLYSVTVEAKNAAGKTTTLSIPVVVSEANGKMMTAVKDANVYKEENGSMVQANLVNFNVLHTGSAVRVFGTPVTKKLNGQDVQFYRIVSPTTNLWVRADVLKDGVVNTTEETTKNVTVMHIAAIYNKEGKQISADKLRAYETVSVVSDPIEIGGKKFYKLAGKDQYIKVANIDGTTKTLKKNSYVYKRRATGSFYATKAAKRNKKHAGDTVTVYGGKLYGNWYRIGKNQYIRSRNF